MNNIWFISDTHFGHKNILEYEKESRPFATLDEMHEVLIERWNNVIKCSDTVYHLGDFAFGKRNIIYAHHLNGKKRLVMGNHDTHSASEYLLYFDKLYGAFHWERCIMTHIPVHPSSLGSRFLLNLHGHLHSRKVREIYLTDTEGFEYQREDINYFNVSCEQNNLTPIHADIIRDRIKELI